MAMAARQNVVRHWKEMDAHMKKMSRKWHALLRNVSSNRDWHGLGLCHPHADQGG